MSVCNNCQKPVGCASVLGADGKYCTECAGMDIDVTVRYRIEGETDAEWVESDHVRGVEQ